MLLFELLLESVVVHKATVDICGSFHHSVVIVSFGDVHCIGGARSPVAASDTSTRLIMQIVLLARTIVIIIGWDVLKARVR